MFCNSIQCWNMDVGDIVGAVAIISCACLVLVTDSAYLGCLVACSELRGCLGYRFDILADRRGAMGG